MGQHAEATADQLHTKALELAVALADSLPLGAPKATVVADLRFLIEGIAAGVEFSSTGLVDRHMAWQKARTRAVGGDVVRLEDLPACLLGLAAPWLDPTGLLRLGQVLSNSATYLRFVPATVPPGLESDGAAAQFLAAALRGDRLATKGLVAKARSVPDFLEQVLEPMQREVGRLWLSGCLNPAEEHLVTNHVHDAVLELATRQPAVAADAPLVALVRAHGDEHSLGQAFLELYVRAEGLRTRKFGAPEAPGQALTMLAALRPHALALSCTTPQQLRSVGALIAAIRRDPALAAIPVLLGGSMFAEVPQLATQLGADGGGSSGRQAASMLRSMLHAPAVGRD